MATYNFACRICGAIGNHPTFVGREMMFGTREVFEYFQCSSCSCLQISVIPNDLSRFYPSNYYSLGSENHAPASSLRRFLLRQRFRNAIFGKGYKLNKILGKVIEMPDLRVDTVLPVATVLQTAGVRDFSASFLDVGCGNSSQWLANLKIMGFSQLFGVDPFINANVRKNGISIYRGSTREIAGKFDLISFHHSLEHVPNQVEELTGARHLLKPNGVILVRIPVVSSYSWKHYGPNWVEMDPPRHLFLHSRESVRILGEKVGLELYATICDSFEFEFYGSEQYLKNIPLTAEESHWPNQNSKIFTQEEVANFKRMASQANATNECGRACFFFRAAS